MHSPVPLSMAKVLSDARSERVAWARFDFRGVGASEGAYDEGRGEVDDTLAVVAEMQPSSQACRCSRGHSFGSWVALRAAAASAAAIGSCS